MGSAFSQSLDPGDVETVVHRAIGFARVAQPDPYFKGIPSPSVSSEVEGLCDEEIKSLTLEGAGVLARRMIDGVEGVRRGAKYRGNVGAGCSGSYLMTSTGVSIGTDRSYAGAYIAPTYREGEDIGSSDEYDYAISLTEMDLEGIGRKAAEKALGQFGSRKVESGILPVILMPDPVGALCSGLLAAISGENVVKGRTFAASYLGKQIAPEVLEIGDDATIPGAIESSTYDGEGVPRRPIKVVSRGRITTFLHNYYSAGIAGVTTTGHAQRWGYGDYVGAGPTNVRVSGGDSSIDEMVADIERGILVTSAGLFPNIVSGELSSTIDEGFLIEGGEKVHPVKNLMAGGQLLEICGDIELISKEGRTIGKGNFYPAIKIRQLKLAGK
jgi:PmbA protein